MMRRRLSLQKETLAELGPADLTSVAGGAEEQTQGRVCHALSFRFDCGLPTCNFQCTNTSTVYKG